MKHIPIQKNLIPKSLERAKKANSSWKNYSKSEDGKELRQLKAQEQKGLCGYCECRLTDQENFLQPGSAHIDHFYQRKRCPQLTFSWDNMVLSCIKEDSCGRYKDKNTKDRKRIPSEKLINLHQEDPRKYITFICLPKNSQQGQGFYRLIAQPVPGLADQDKQKAENTIKALNLNLPRLSTLRHDAWCKHQGEIEELCSLFEKNDIDEEVLKECVQELLEEIEKEEYPSALLACAKAELKDFLSL